jgi:hypothetical protein
MYQREFVGSKEGGYYEEVEILVLTPDYENFSDFKSEDINGAINSERKISKFLEKITGLFQVYSLNDFYQKKSN